MDLSLGADLALGSWKGCQVVSPLVLWASLAIMALCADVLPPGAEPVYPGHTALCQATPGEGEGTRPPIWDGVTLRPCRVHDSNTQKPIPCTLEHTSVLDSSHICFSLPHLQVRSGLGPSGFPPPILSCCLRGPGPSRAAILSPQPVPLMSGGVHLNLSDLSVGSQRPSV